jgi:hypothetical protein
MSESAALNGAGSVTRKLDRDIDRAKALLQRTHDEHKDSLHILPLSSIPLSTAGLQKWQMMKNARLDSVIQVYTVDKRTHGQIPIHELGKYFDDRESLLKDIPILKKVSQLHSFDVYTLRIELRRLGISVTEQGELQLSDSRRQDLLHFMREFTRPLIQNVFGGEGATITDFEQLVGMFSQPDKGEALRNLKILADRLQVGLTEIPNFLEEYGDIALSMAYFRGIFAELLPRLRDFSQWAKATAESYRFKQDVKFQEKYAGMVELLEESSKAVSAILASFDDTAKSFWGDIRMESFKAMRNLITDQHVVIGAWLCGLYVTNAAWQQQFAGKRANPDKCAEFIQAEIIPGLSAAKRATLPKMARIEHPPVINAV